MDFSSSEIMKVVLIKLLEVFLCRGHGRPCSGRAGWRSEVACENARLVFYEPIPLWFDSKGLGDDSSMCFKGFKRCLRVVGGSLEKFKSWSKGLHFILVLSI
ncbi:hypothetical protein Dimus_038437 [Dionaea muscipula]